MTCFQKHQTEQLRQLKNTVLKENLGIFSCDEHSRIAPLEALSVNSN